MNEYLKYVICFVGFIHPLAINVELTQTASCFLNIAQEEGVIVPNTLFSYFTKSPSNFKSKSESNASATDVLSPKRSPKTLLVYFISKGGGGYSTKQRCKYRL